MKKNNLNEGSSFMISAKRKRGESAAEYISTKAPLRHKVLEFIDSKKSVTEEDLKAFLNDISEDVGFQPSPNWVKNNKHLIDIRVNDEGNKTYKLSQRGQNILRAHRKFEGLREDIKKQVIDELKGRRPRINDKVSFDDILTGKGVNAVTEARIATGFINQNAVLRNKILEFIHSKGKVTLAEMKEFFKTLNEEIGKMPSSSYLSQNKHLIDRQVDSNGVSHYTLTNQGKTVMNHFKKLNND